VSGTALAQYTRSAGVNAPSVAAKEDYVDSTGTRQQREVQVKAAPDRHGNASGNQHDLAVDGAFDGQTVAVLHFYAMEDFDFSLPKKALAEKGFSVYRWVGQPPSPEELEAKLKKACQLWIISSEQQLLRKEHLAVISASSTAARASTSGATTSRTTRTRTPWPGRCWARRCAAT
jgi:hypothetical protein